MGIYEMFDHTVLYCIFQENKTCISKPGIWITDATRLA